MVALLLIVSLEQETSAQDINSDWNISTLNNPAPGYLQIAEFAKILDPAFIDNYGKCQYLDSNIIRNAKFCTFLSNGSWIVQKDLKYYVYSPEMLLLDSIPLEPGYEIDFHEVVVMANGHYLLLYLEDNIVDLSQVVTGGKSNATVKSNVLIETDQTGTIYWIWKAIDHISITDATQDVDLTQNTIDYTHANSFFEDQEGNIIISFKNLDEIIKINKTSGDILWRLGGSASRRNDFSFINDELDGFNGFSHQHSISILPNGNLLMFDNGNLKPTPYSRAVEYQIDQVNMTASKIWEYKGLPLKFRPSMGSAVRLPNGNTLINWSTENITEVTPNNTIAFEMTFALPEIVYKANRVLAYINAVTKTIQTTGDYIFDDGKYATGATLRIENINGQGLISVEKHNYAPPKGEYSDSNFTSILPYRWVASHTESISDISGKISLKGASINGIGNPAKISIYYRQKENYGVFQELNTSYNTNSDAITAIFPGLGEFTLGTKLLSVPIPKTPNNNANNIPVNGQLEWNKVKAADQYYVQVSTSATFNKLVSDQITDNITQISYQGLDNFTKYYWRVRSKNSKDVSDWSEVFSFTTTFETPVLIFPSNNLAVENLNENLQWEAVTGAAYYIVRVSANSNLSKPIIDISNLDANTFQLNGLHANTKYYWKVLAYAGADSSEWSQTWSFAVSYESPKLVSPVSDTINIAINVDFIWLPMSEAVSYSFELVKSPSFDTCINKTINLTMTSLHYANLEYNQKYYWRIKAIRKDNESNWSETGSFTTMLAAPVLTFPANGGSAEVFDSKLSWNSTSVKNSYRLQISRTKDFTEALLDFPKLTYPAVYLLEIPASTELYWRVMALDSLQASDWSEVWKFETIKASPREAPILMSPSINSECNNYGNFSWSKVSRAFRYRLQVSTTNDFKTLAMDTSYYGMVSCNYENFSNSKEYFWRVKAYCFYDSSKWSETGTFKTLLLSSVKLLYPKNDQLHIPAFGQLIWSAIPGIRNYFIQISDNPKFNKPLVIDLSKIQDTSYSYAGLKPFTTYYWRLRFIRDIDTSKWSAAWKFTTESETELASPAPASPNNYQSGVPIDGTLAWNPVKDAKSYKISISSSQDFETVAFSATNEPDTLANYTGLDNNRMYYWRVSASNEKSESPWSQVGKFLTELKSPTIISPADNAIRLPATGQLLWANFPDVDSYLVQISLDSLFGSFDVNTKVNDASFDYVLSKDRTYYWRLRSWSYMNRSRWSGIFKFSTFDPNSVYENRVSQKMLLYPNPVDNYINIIGDSYQNKVYSIFNISGFCQIKNRVIDGPIDIYNLPSGAYYIVIGNESLNFIKR